MENGHTVTIPTEEEKALIHAGLFHDAARGLEAQLGRPLSHDELDQLDGLMDEMTVRGRATGHIAVEAERGDF